MKLRNLAGRRKKYSGSFDCSASDTFRYLVGGVNSPVRSFRAVEYKPVYFSRGNGPRLVDVSGREYIDYILGWGSLILGHSYGSVVDSVRDQVFKSTLLGLSSPAEIALAKEIASAIPSIEQVRFTASGTEACMVAVRIARAYTGREKILTFEGCYHGHSDSLLVKRGSGLATFGISKSAGVPNALVKDTLVVSFNDLKSVKKTVEKIGKEIACIIVEPVPANMGVIVPEEGFLEGLRSISMEHGILLIFDEVVSGFRLCYSGAQGLLGIKPDITVLGKIVGGGFPIGAVGAGKHLMRLLAPEGAVYHAGTFAGHPVSMAAGLETLNQLKANPPYSALDELASVLEDGLKYSAKKAGERICINRFGSMLTVFPGLDNVQNFDQAKKADRGSFSRLANGLRERGVLIPPSVFEAWFLSSAHTALEIEKTNRAFFESLS